MSTFRLAANLSFMFKDQENLLDRYNCAKNAGFKGVEVAFPYEYPIEKLIDAKTSAGVEQVLINSWPGDLAIGELGLAAIPGRENEFLKTLETTIEYAKALKCKRIHVVSGKRMKLIQDAAMDSVYEENIENAVERLSKENLTMLIEPISNYAVPLYYMNSFEKAMNLISKIKSPNLKLQMDLYHLQMLRGNLTHHIKELLPSIGHIQIAQVPNRNEPNTPGEINYQYILNLLSELNYDGWVGCEYNPKGDVVKGLNWISQCGLTLF